MKFLLNIENALFEENAIINFKKEGKHYFYSSPYEKVYKIEEKMFFTEKNAIGKVLDSDKIKIRYKFIKDNKFKYQIIFSNHYVKYIQNSSSLFIYIPNIINIKIKINVSDIMIKNLFTKEEITCNKNGFPVDKKKKTNDTLFPIYFIETKLNQKIDDVFTYYENNSLYLINFRDNMIIISCSIDNYYLIVKYFIEQRKFYFEITEEKIEIKTYITTITKNVISIDIDSYIREVICFDAKSINDDEFNEIVDQTQIDSELLNYEV